MNHLKTKKEIRNVVQNLPKEKKQRLAYLVANVFNNGDGECFDEIDNDFVYPLRWELFESKTDSPILYEEDQVNEFIDTCIGIMLAENEGVPS